MNINFIRKLVIINSAVPLALLAWDAARGNLGANSVNQAIHITGILTLVFLFLSLLITPIRELTGWSSFIAYRRALGLSAFFYSLVHLAIFVVYDRGLNLSSTLNEILTRRYLQVGIVAILLMVPLAITSTNAMIRRLGAKKWKLLHRLVYIVVILGVVHYYLLVKSDVRQPLIFAAVLTPILGYRVVGHYLNLRNAAKQNTGSAKPKSENQKFWRGSLKIARVFDETHDVKTFRFVSHDNQLPFKHTPGQYLNLQLEIDRHLVRRSYTICSAPSQRAYCEISVKRDGLASNYLHENFTAGKEITVSAPAGKFVFHGHESDSVLLVSGGVGITPMMAITRWLNDIAWNGTIYFLHVSKTEGDLIFRKELELLSQRNSNLKILWALTRDAEATIANLHGRLTKEFVAKKIPNLQSMPIYLCGPDAMMVATRELLVECGAIESSIMTEDFISPPATSDSSNLKGAKPGFPVDATIAFSNSNKTTQVEQRTTVLEAAEAAGVEIPFECRSGICGQCKVKCVNGSVQMASQDALTSAEKADDYILSCQAIATTPELTIEA